MLRFALRKLLIHDYFPDPSPDTTSISPMNDNTEVKLHFLDYWRVIKQRMGLILLTFFLVIVSSAVYVIFLPKQFYSRVTIEIKPDKEKGVDPFGMSGSGRADPQFISTQFQVLKKNEILYPVIEKLNLVKELSPPGQIMPLTWIANQLGRSMEVQEQRNTTLIEVGIFDTDKKRAADIANTIAYIYRDKRVEDLKKNIEQTLAEMRDELDNQKTKVAKFYSEAAKIRQEEGIIDPDPESTNALVSIGGDRPVAITENLRLEQRNVVDTLRGLLTRIEALQPTELMEALRALGIQDVSTEKNIQLLLDAQAEEARMLNSGLGENHPRLRALRAQSDIFKKQLADQLESIRRAQKTKLLVEEAKLKTIEANYTTLKKDSIDEKTRINGYVEKKSEYLMAKSLMQVIEQRHAAAKFDSLLSVNPVKIWERAEPGLTWEKPRIPVYLALAAMIGLVVGVGLAFFIEYLDTSVKRVDDIERYLQLPVLAVINRDVCSLIKMKRDTADAEAYRILKGNIEFNQSDREANTYTLVSGGPGEGKSTTLNNLAFTFAKGGANVLVVDADLRRPSQQRFFETDNDRGLVDFLQGKATIEEITKTTRLDNLSFIPSGKLPQDDAGILSGPRMLELMRKLKSQYDIVFFDSPPILGVSDASVLVSEVDNTIMVVQHRRFPRNMLQRVKQTVTHVGGNLIGVVLNNYDEKTDDSYSYYSGYNEYYSPKKERADAKKAMATAKSGSEEEY